jgi:VCBS repeat-containing protein
MADTTIHELEIALPGSGNTEVYHLDADTPVKFDFDPSNAMFTGENGNLEIAVDGGGTVILENYQALADSGHLPLFEMPNGEMVAGNTYLFAFNGPDQITDLETAAGNAAGGSGAGQYTDDHGALYAGINALGGQGDAYDPHTFPTSDPVTGLILEGTTGVEHVAPTIDLSTSTVTFVSEDANNNNMIGIYQVDADGNPTNPELILLDSNTATPGQVLTTIEDGEELHYFLVVGADHGSDSAVFVPNGSGGWDISFDGGTTTYAVRFDDYDGLNRNGDFEATFKFTVNDQGRVVALDDQMRNDQSALGDDDDDFNDTIIQENANAGTGYDNTFTPGYGAVHISGEVNISDSDSTHMSLAVITLTNAQAGDALGLDTSALPSGITATVTGTEITLSGDATIADYESAIELITYNNTAANPDASDRLITVQVWDDTSPTGEASNVATARIEINAPTVLESAPMAAALLSTSLDEGVDAHAQAADPDSDHSAMISTLTGATTQATGNLLDSYGEEAANLTASIVDSAMGAWGALEVSSTGDWTYTPYDSASIGDTSTLTQPTVETFTYQVTDTVHGGTDTATLYIPVHVDATVSAEGTTGNDVIYGHDGGSTISGLEGNDFLYGGTGDDHLDGGAGHDYISGGAGNDTLLGGAGNDYLFGGAGNDHIEGGTGNDTIWGGAGNDTIDAGAGNDTVYISSGHDTVALGTGADTVVVDPTYLTPGDGGGSMTITDFNIGEGDHIDLSSMSSGVANITSDSTSGDLVLTIADVNHAGDGITITLQGVMPASHADVHQSMDLSATGDEVNHLIQHIINTGGHTS